MIREWLYTKAIKKLDEDPSFGQWTLGKLDRVVVDFGLSHGQFTGESGAWHVTLTHTPDGYRLLHTDGPMIHGGGSPRPYPLKEDLVVVAPRGGYEPVRAVADDLL